MWNAILFLGLRYHLQSKGNKLEGKLLKSKISFLYFVKFLKSFAWHIYFFKAKTRNWIPVPIYMDSINIYKKRYENISKSVYQKNREFPIIIKLQLSLYTHPWRRHLVQTYIHTGTKANPILMKMKRKVQLTNNNKKRKKQKLFAWHIILISILFWYAVCFGHLAGKKKKKKRQLRMTPTRLISL